MSYPTCSGISCSIDGADRDPRLRKDDSKKAQSGRSMIEMLGVLAIIGVLSVGGIAGYSKAMEKYRINKTINQISLIVNGIQTAYISQKNYNGLTTNTEAGRKILKKTHIIPEEMWNSAGTQVEHVFDGPVRIMSSSKKDYNDNKAFVIQLDGIPEEACIELSSLDWGAGTTGLVAVAAGSASGLDSYKVGCAGQTGRWSTTACPNGPTVSVPMPVDIAVAGCDSVIDDGCDPNRYNCDQYRTFGLKFY